MASIKGLERTLVALDKGIVRSPSIGKDGELSECINLHPRGGEMVNQPMPLDYPVDLQLGDDETLVYLHHHDGVVNYITVTNGSRLQYLKKVADSEGNEVWSRGDVGYDYYNSSTKITSLGRMLVIYGENSPAAALMWQMQEDGTWKYSDESSYNKSSYGIGVRFAGGPITTHGIKDNNASSGTIIMDGHFVEGGYPVVLYGVNGEATVLVRAGVAIEQSGNGFGVGSGSMLPVQVEDNLVWYTAGWQNFFIGADATTASTETKSSAIEMMGSLLGNATALITEALDKALVVAPFWFYWELRNASNEIVLSGNPTLICPNQTSTLPNLGVQAYRRSQEGYRVAFVPQASIPAYSCAFNITLDDLPSDTEGLTMHIYMSRQKIYNTLRSSAGLVFNEIFPAGSGPVLFEPCAPNGQNKFYVLRDGMLNAWNVTRFTKEPTTEVTNTLKGELPNFFEVWSGSLDSLAAAKKEGKNYVRLLIKSEYVTKSDDDDIVTENTVNLDQSATVGYWASGRSSSISGKYIKCALPYNGRMFYAGFVGADSVGGVLKEYSFDELFSSSIVFPVTTDIKAYRYHKDSPTTPVYGSLDNLSYLYNGQKTRVKILGNEFFDYLLAYGNNTYNTVIVKYKHGDEFFYSSISGTALRGIIRSIFLPTYIAEIQAGGGTDDKFIATSIRLAEINNGEVDSWTKEIEVEKGNLGYWASTYTSQLLRLGSCGKGFEVDDDKSAAATWLTDTLRSREGDSPDGYAMSAYASTNIPGASDFKHLSGSTIQDVAVVTRPVSPGQFGQHPIMLFTDDGVWAVEITGEGETATAPQPVTREVAYPGTILCLDDALSFVSSKGLVLLSGNNVINVSEPVCGYNTDLEQFFKAGGLPWPDVLFKDDKDFREKLRNAQFLYDYSNSAIHAVYRVGEGEQVHYIYNLLTKAWTTQSLSLGGGDIKNIVHNYPNDIMQVGDKLYYYDYHYDGERTTDGLILTKPLTLGDPTARKMLYDLKVIGQRTTDNSKMQVMVFISNDCRNWYRLRSLKGMSAKYYRLLISTKMTDVDTLSGVVLQHVARFDKKMR